MINRAALKSWAKDSLKGNWGVIIGAIVIYYLIAMVLSATFVGSFFAGVVAVGLVAINLSLLRTKTAKIEMLFSGITENFGTKLVAALLVPIFTFLWSLLFFIPGIVKSYSYGMTYYILLDRPELSATEAITESRKMMDGHKMELFVLDLSFFGWFILTGLTFGLLGFYVLPYYMQTKTAFYETLKSANESANFAENLDSKNFVNEK